MDIICDTTSKKEVFSESLEMYGIVLSFTNQYKQRLNICSIFVLILVLIINCMCFAAKHPIVENCDLSLKKCTVRMTCGLALHDYRISCKQELYGKTNTSCSELCQLSIISLANTAEGFDYLNCDCADNTYCNLIRNRTKSCYPEVDPVSKSCRVTELYCKADPSCVEAWNYFRYLCEQMFVGKECTKRCNDSLAILTRNRVGVNVRDCSCDQIDSSYQKCRSEQNNLQKLCYGTDVSNTTIASSVVSKDDTLFYISSMYITVGLLRQYITSSLNI